MGARDTGRELYEAYIDDRGDMHDYDAAVNMMDDEIRERLHDELAPCSAQAFVEAYAVAHSEKFPTAGSGRPTTAESASARGGHRWRARQILGSPQTSVGRVIS